MPETKPQQDVLSSVTSVGTGGGSTVATSSPTAQPPAAVTDAIGGTATGGIGASVWVNNKKINALWAINENRNSWVSVAGTGWVKFSNNSDSAIVAFTVLGTSARQTQGVVNYRQEADNMIHEIYVW